MLTDSREHVLKTALGESPVSYSKSALVLLHLNEHSFSIEPLERYLVDKAAVELTDHDGIGQQLFQEVNDVLLYLVLVQSLLSLKLILIFPVFLLLFSSVHWVLDDFLLETLLLFQLLSL